MREAHTYRAQKRNARIDRGDGKTKRRAGNEPRKPGIAYGGQIRLNRAERWPTARSYEHAREIGPSSEPVR